jgi:hypothetical protein
VPGCRYRRRHAGCGPPRNRERVDDAEREPEADENDKRPEQLAPRRMLPPHEHAVRIPTTGTSSVKGATVDAG